jgi:hypothetical protein
VEESSKIVPNITTRRNNCLLASCCKLLSIQKSTGTGVKHRINNLKKIETYVSKIKQIGIRCPRPACPNHRPANTTATATTTVQMATKAVLWKYGRTGQGRVSGLARKRLKFSISTRFRKRKWQLNFQCSGTLDKKILEFSNERSKKTNPFHRKEK